MAIPRTFPDDSSVNSGNLILFKIYNSVNQLIADEIAHLKDKKKVQEEQKDKRKKDKKKEKEMQQ